jgi:hypothetical protein
MLALPRLSTMSAHEALFLTRNALAMPKLLYILRTSPCFLSDKTQRYDNIVRKALSQCLNISLGDNTWSQASLPVRWGGLGVRSATSLAPSAFLSSRFSVDSLIHNLLPDSFHQSLPIPDKTDKLTADAIAHWSAIGGIDLPADDAKGKQRAWDNAICQAQMTHLQQDADDIGKSRLLAVSSKGAGSWLHAIPSVSIGLRLSADEVRTATGLRLGCPLVREHTCGCGKQVSSLGTHGLSCRRSAGRHLRHRLANDVIVRAFRSADTPAELEPLGLLRGDGKRPDGATLIPWTRGRCLLWDFTCPDTLAPSHLNHSVMAAGSAAQVAESNKRAKYSNFIADYEFVPVAIETLGAWGSGALELVRDLGTRIAQTTGDSRATTFLRQRLDVAIQRGNAAAIRGTLPAANISDSLEI